MSIIQLPNPPIHYRPVLGKFKNPDIADKESYGKKSTSLRKGKTTAGELWKGITALIHHLIAILRDLPCPYGNMGTMIGTDVQ